MGRFRLSRPLTARAGYLAGVAALVAGIYLTRGLGAALIVGGLVTAATFLLAYDVEGDAARESPSVDQKASRGYDPTL